MLLNLRPTTAVEINLVKQLLFLFIHFVHFLFEFLLKIVQSTEQERLTEEEIEELLQMVQTILPEPPTLTKWIDLHMIWYLL